jgi:hypothetical protein
MALAVTVGYDWFFDVLANEQKDLLAQTVYDYALVPGNPNKLLSNWWSWSKINWNHVCYGALGIACMAFADRWPDHAAKFLRRAWYENMSFWSPDMFRRFMKPQLMSEARLAREAGARFGYINSCMYMNLLDDFRDIGMDVLIGVDPVEDSQLDMSVLKQKMQDNICLWGGGNGFVTVEEGTPDEVRLEVNRAIDILAPGGGFILSPVDNVRDMSEKTMENAKVFIEAWKDRKNESFA